jgi:hypothetical protein
LDISRLAILETATSHTKTAANSKELALKLFISAMFLPEGLSFFIGDLRLSAARLLLIGLVLFAALTFRQRPGALPLASDFFATSTGIWLILAPIVTQGAVSGLKSGGIMALEFAGAYWIFRSLPNSSDSSISVVRFATTLLIPVVFLALLDPLTGTLFSYETTKSVTGYVASAWEWAKQVNSSTMFRNGLVRAMGPLEHSILFGAVCGWFGTLALCVFPSRVFGWAIATTAGIGIYASQARGPLLAYILSLVLIAYYYLTSGFNARWRVVFLLLFGSFAFLFIASENPLAFVLRLTGIDEETRWYRQAIWEAVIPMIAHQSPLFGLGIGQDWDWKTFGLAGDSVDAFWLRLSMTSGFPASILMMLTLLSSYWGGSIDRSLHLSHEEQRLSVALGIVTFAAIFLGFIVHFWGTCWILIAVFAGLRANLVARVKMGL